jgi:hypothetical protein
VVVLLGVVQRAESAQLARRQRLVVEQDRRGDDRAREAAATRLVGTGDEANAERAVEGEEPVAAGPAPCPAPRPRARGTRCGPAASKWRRLLR